QAVISGLVQGVAEFLPISSSGHLVILHKLMGLNEPEIFFDIFLHLGTLAAIFIVFGREIIESITTKKRIGLLILISSAVTFVIVLFFIKNIEATFNNVKTVGLMLIITGIWLIAGNLIRLGSEGMTVFKACVIGLAQGIAALPGISRSGATISTGLFLGLDGQAAAKFSFLLSIPAILGAFVFKIKEAGFNLAEVNANYFIGFFVSCIVGIISLKLLLRILYKNKFHWFGAYCILAGITVFLFLK
ncbi:MAG: undecaprenyl-diphosphate phosphatase, partial [Candidatus Omnitrophota bacterium]|nr:undecaprenyl-diphosphate phosphatase [Candidatus Omnitrophota bacterium]